MTRFFRRVFSLYSAFDLRGTPSVSTALQLYCDHYAPTQTDKQNASPAYHWSTARNTTFRMWHGVNDFLVPYQQSVNFAAQIGSKGSSLIIPGLDHALPPAERLQMIADAGSYFAA